MEDVRRSARVRLAGVGSESDGNGSFDVIRTFSARGIDRLSRRPDTAPRARYSRAAALLAASRM